VKNEIFRNLKENFFSFNAANVENLVKESLSEGISPIKTADVLTSSLNEIGTKFEKGDLWLPDLMLAANVMKKAMEILEEEIKSKGLERKIVGKVVIGTVFGDVHDIGKTMVSTLLEANGFKVIDLGVNIKSEKFVEAVERHQPQILAMSALLTTTASEQKKTIDTLMETKIREKIKVIVGGAPITQEFADKIGADGYEPTAVLAVNLAKRLIS